MNIKEIDLDITLPTDKAGFTVTQPYATLTTTEPYKYTATTKQAQLQNIRRTLEVAKQQQNGALQTHFTIFPEYALPGTDAVEIIHNEISSSAWPNNSFIIGGLDALSKKEYEEISSKYSPELAC